MSMLTIAFRRKGVHEFLRFAVVGVATFCINLGSLYAFLRLFPQDYQIAVSLAYVLTVLCHFLANRFFTFRAEQQRITRHAFLYAGMLAVNYGTSLVVSWLVIGAWALPPYVAVISYTACNAMISFLAMKFVVFNPHLSRAG